MNIKNGRELEFAVFCIENVASFLGKEAQDVNAPHTEQGIYSE